MNHLLANLILGATLDFLANTVFLKFLKIVNISKSRNSTWNSGFMTYFEKEEMTRCFCKNVFIIEQQFPFWNIIGFIEQSIRKPFKGNTEIQFFRCTSKFLCGNVRLIYVPSRECRTKWLFSLQETSGENVLPKKQAQLRFLRLMACVPKAPRNNLQIVRFIYFNIFRWGKFNDSYILIKSNTSWLK